MDLRQKWDHFLAVALARTSVQKANPVILKSWRRSHDAGVDSSAQHIYLTKVEARELQHRLEKNSVLVTLAKPLLDNFSELHEKIGHVIYLVDADGIVLYSRGTDQMMRVYGLMPGYDWSEEVMGTNGAGTALASGRPVAVIGPDHYQLPFREASCLAAPVRSPNGKIVGAIDFSSHVNDVDPAQLEQIIKIASVLERQLSVVSFGAD